MEYTPWAILNTLVNTDKTDSVIPNIETFQKEGIRRIGLWIGKGPGGFSVGGQKRDINTSVCKGCWGMIGEPKYEQKGRVGKHNN